MKKNTEMLLTNSVLPVQSHSIALTNFLSFFRLAKLFVFALMILSGTFSSAWATDITLSSAVVINSSNKSQYEGKSVAGTIPANSYVGEGGNFISRGAIVVDGIELNLTIEGLNVDYSEANSMLSGISLVKGAKLHLTVSGVNNITAGYGGAGIAVPDGCTLEITSSSTGTLNATGGKNYGGGAGIGSIGNKSHGDVNAAYTIPQGLGDIVINGGTINAQGGTFYYQYLALCGAAGIGSSIKSGLLVNNPNYDDNTYVKKITGSVTINGGKVNATGGYLAAGIGGGTDGTLKNITITGGTVTATRGIGTSLYNAAAIGLGVNTTNTDSDSSLTCPAIELTGGNITANGNIGYSDTLLRQNIGGSVKIGQNAQLTCTGTIAPFEAANLPSNSYVDKDGILQHANSPKSAENQTELTAGWWVVDKDMTANDRIIVQGEVNLILNEGFTLTANKGIQVFKGNTLNIYAQMNGTGKIIATGDTSNAGIGGGYVEGKSGTFYDLSCGTINIYGGTIEANGGQDGAGIGCGVRKSDTTDGGIIKIFGGNVKAKGGKEGAGIGSGGYGDGNLTLTNPQSIYIYGGNVEATGGEDAAAIGGGMLGTGGTIVISGGNVSIVSRLDTDYNGIGYGNDSGSLTSDYQATITLGWTNFSDTIQSNAYRGTVTFAEGKTFAYKKGNVTVKDFEINSIPSGVSLIPCFTVTFEKNRTNGVTGPNSGSEKVVTGSEYTLPGGLSDWKDINNRIVFDGWLINGVKYATGYKITVLSDLVLKATWIEKKDVYFYSNDGTNNKVSQQLVEYGKTATEPEAPTRTGYTFGGWYKESTCTNAWNFDTDTVTDDINLYAKWTPIKYNITYELNGGTNDSGNPASYTIESADITLNNPTKTGYKFTGWTPNGVINSGSTGDKNFTANWTAQEYKISFDLNGGKLGTDQGNPTSYDINSENFSPANPTRDGYEFEGWLLSGDTTGAVSKDLTVPNGSTGDREYIAQWKAIKYSISYRLDGGTVSPDNPASYTAESADIKLTNPTRNGYDFTGWSFDAKISLDVTIPKGSTGDKNFSAIWSLITYPISYDLNGGNLSTATPTGYTAESNSITLNNPTKTGYNFKGWTGSNGSTPQTSVTIANGSTGNKTFKANWTAVEYSITYELNNGNLSTATPTGYTIESNAITLNNPSRNGYQFDGWTGTNLTAKTQTVTIAKGSTGNRSYVANFTPIKYAITYNLDGGTNNPDNPAEYTVEDLITLKDPTKTGYKFTGWTPNGVINSGSTGDKNFTANWTAQEYKISFDLNGGKLGTDQNNPTSYDINSENFSPANPTREGYEFEGWLLSGDTTGAVSKDLTVPNGSTGDREYIAQWKAIKYSISYGLDGGTVSPDNPASYTAESADIKLTNPTRNGYDFTGWSFDAKISLDVTIPKGSTGDKNFSAIWSLITYPISYDLNGGNLSTANPTGYTAESNSITLNNPSRNGYQFDGWTGTNLTAKTQTVTIANGSTGNRSYIANFTPIKYAITYNLDGGTNNSGNPAEYTVEDSITLKDPTKTGYDFDGWTPEGTINKGSTGNKTFTATWTAQKGGENPEPEPVDPDKPDPDEPETVTDAEEISKMTSDELKKKFGNTTEIALTGEIKNLEEVLEKLADAGVKVETLDLSNAKVEEVKIPENSPVSSINLKGNTSVKEVEVSGSKNLQTLDLTGSTVRTVDAKGCEKLETVNVEGSENLQKLDVSETKVTSLNVKNCAKLEIIRANSCGNLEEVILDGCESLKELDVSQTSVVSLNAQNCTNLETLNCASCDIKNLDIEGCKNLKIIDCSSNSLTRFDASSSRFGALQKLSCGNQHVKGFSRTRHFNILDLLFMRLMNVSTADENENETDDTANVKDVKAFDGNGNEISATFDDETGEVTFSQEPAEIRYNYITGFNDIKMDVTVSASDSSEGEIDESNESGGGCNSVRSNELGVRSVLILALLALAFAFGKKPGFKKP